MSENQTTTSKFLVHVGGDKAERFGTNRLSNYEKKISMTIENYGRGRNNGGIYFNDYYIPPQDVKKDIYGHKYYIRHNAKYISIKGELDIVDGRGKGHITINNEADYILDIAPWAVYYKVKVSSNCGVHYQENPQQFIWNTESEQWKDEGNWLEDQLIFGYDIYEAENPIIGNYKCLECSFEDLCGTKENNCWETQVIYGKFSMTSSDYLVATLPTCTVDVPESRSDSSVKSVFPTRMELQFDTLGARFTGAYMDAFGNVYGIQGKPAEELALKADNLNSLTAIKPLAHSLGFSPLTGLDVYGLVGINPIRLDSEGKSYDYVGSESMKLFYDAIVVHMDEDLRKTYISETVPVLSSDLRDIVYEPGANKFYEKITTPFLASMLSQSNSKYARQINGIRADTKLSEECAGDETYKRHSDKIYRMVFKQVFPAMKQYLDDQKHTDYNSAMESGFKYIQQTYTDLFSKFTDDEHKMQLQEILKEQDQLLAWGKGKKAYWAFQLYYFLVKFYLSKLLLKMTSGKLGQEVGEEIKNYVALFNMLEGDEEDKEDKDKKPVVPEGPTFAEAFLEALQVMEITVVLPEMIDYTSLGSGTEAIAQDIFRQFMDTYSGSADPEVRKMVESMRILASDQDMCHNLFEMFMQSVNTCGSFASWNNIIQHFSTSVVHIYGAKITSSIINTVAAGYAGTAIAMIIMGNSYEKMSTSEKVLFITAATHLCFNIIMSVVQGIARLAFLWNDFSGLMGGISVLGLFGKYRNMYTTAINNLSSSAAKFLLGDAAMPIDAQAPWYVKVFGSNINQVLNQTVGFVLAVISVVVASIDISKAKDNMVLCMDGLMIASGVLQVIAVAVDIAMVALGSQSIYMAAFCTACGYLAAAAALAGFIVGIVYFCTHESDPLKSFVEDTLKGSGLRMDNECAIEYFNHTSSKKAERNNGISIGSDNKYIKMCEDGTLMLSDSHNSLSTVFNITTDAEGESQIYTSLEDGEGVLHTYCLGIGSNNNPCAVPIPIKPEPLEDGSFDKDLLAAYEEEVKCITWISNCTNIEEKDGGIVTKAKFMLQNKKNSQYLSIANNQILFGILPLLGVSLEFSQISVSGSVLCLGQTEWVLPQNSASQGNSAYFAERVSLPLTWSVEPPLAKGFELTANEDGNSAYIAFEKNSAPALGKQNYVLQVKNTVKSEETAQIAFSIEITLPKEAANA